MLDRLQRDIDLAINWLVSAEGFTSYEDIRDREPKALEAIKAMINAYNKISQYYYLPEHASHWKTKEYIEFYIENMK